VERWPEASQTVIDKLVRGGRFSEGGQAKQAARLRRFPGRRVRPIEYPPKWMLCNAFRLYFRICKVKRSVVPVAMSRGLTRGEDAAEGRHCPASARLCGAAVKGIRCVPINGRLVRQNGGIIIPTNAFQLAPVYLSFSLSTRA